MYLKEGTYLPLVIQKAHTMIAFQPTGIILMLIIISNFVATHFGSILTNRRVQGDMSEKRIERAKRERSERVSE